MAELTVPFGLSSTKYAAIVAKTAGLEDFIDGANEWGTKLRVMLDTWDIGTTDTSSDTSVLTMGYLPVGARVLGFLFWQDGTGAATVGTIKVGGTDAAGASVLTDMTNATKQIVQTLQAFATTPLTAVSAVTITFATQNVDTDTHMVFATLYILED